MFKRHFGFRAIQHAKCDNVSFYRKILKKLKEFFTLGSKQWEVSHYEKNFGTFIGDDCIF